MGRMKLTSQEYIALTDAIEKVLEWDRELRREEGKSWFIKEKDGEYRDYRPEAKEIYEYIKGIPERSFRSKLSQIDTNWEALKDLVEDKIPKQMTIKVSRENYYVLEITICAFVTFHRFKEDEYQEAIEEVLDRLNLHFRRSYGSLKSYMAKQGYDTEELGNPEKDLRKRKYHVDPEESSFEEIWKINKEKEENKLPPRLSKQQKFILAKLSKKNSKREYNKLSYNVAIEFNEGKQKKIEIGKSDELKLTDSHNASISNSINSLEERELVKKTDDGNSKVIELTKKGKTAGKEIIRRANDNRYSLEFNTI